MFISIFIAYQVYEFCNIFCVTSSSKAGVIDSDNSCISELIDAIDSINDLNEKSPLMSFCGCSRNAGYISFIVDNVIGNLNNCRKPASFRLLIGAKTL